MSSHQAQVGEVCNSDGSSSATEIQTNHDTELTAINQWETDNAGTTGASTFAAAARTSLSSKLDACIALAPASEQQSIAETAATTSAEAVEDLLSSGENLDSVSDTLNSISDSLSNVLGGSGTATMSTDSLTLTVANSPETANVLSATSPTSSVALTLDDGTRETGTPSVTGWGSTVGALGPDAASSSGKGIKSILLVETDQTPIDIPDRTREGGFVMNGLSRCVRIVARQGGEVIGASRLPLSSLSSRSVGGRTSRRRLEKSSKEEENDVDENMPSTDGNISASGRRLEDTANVEVTGSNVARLILPWPLFSRQLFRIKELESEHRAEIGKEGGEWIQVCAQLDVQNELWTTAGCVGPDLSSSNPPDAFCTCKLRSLETTLVLALQVRYIAPEANQPESLTPSVHKVETKEEVLGISSLLWIGITSLCFIITFSGGILAAWLEEQKDLPGARKRSAEVAVDKRNANYRVRSSAVSQSRNSSSSHHVRSSVLTQASESDPSPAKAALTGGKGGSFSMEGSSPSWLAEGVHKWRLRKFFNPKRVLAWQAAQKQQLERTKQKGRRKWYSLCGHLCPAPFRQCARRIALRERSLLLLDLPRLRQARELQKKMTLAETQGYLQNCENKKKHLWQELDNLLHVVVAEYGFKFEVHPWHEKVSQGALKVFRRSSMGEGEGDYAVSGPAGRRRSIEESYEDLSPAPDKKRRTLIVRLRSEEVRRDSIFTNSDTDEQEEKSEVGRSFHMRAVSPGAVSSRTEKRSSQQDDQAVHDSRQVRMALQDIEQRIQTNSIVAEDLDEVIDLLNNLEAFFQQEEGDNAADKMTIEDSRSFEEQPVTATPPLSSSQLNPSKSQSRRALLDKSRPQPPPTAVITIRTETAAAPSGVLPRFSSTPPIRLSSDPSLASSLSQMASEEDLQSVDVHSTGTSVASSTVGVQMKIQNLKRKIREQRDEVEGQYGKYIKEPKHMAVITPVDLSRQGAVPLRSMSLGSVETWRTLRKLSDAKPCPPSPFPCCIRDNRVRLSPLSDVLLFVLRVLFSWNVLFTLNLFILLDETDERLTPRRPATYTTAPEGLSLPGY
uniref:Uncharacterized protein n=1 Tax=Chromera velia CCMP2878 TaxID=1169474 RepID=A0A0G4HNS4_9ALVE|eukprot:Cvel_29587.t1-p1 / transcript=Cvel_29587.t1 / gene=Cvel_29587 / organism=Chromera_velia_CCMP2878 / gene_product=hypothetical protein / transcript_product=hypothetical protein / location=Cvel_scaffold4075:1586-8741(+) / protein_length=1072 / sequence_SO=supercontig / SO=protein_coding / is_pseudo=false